MTTTNPTTRTSTIEPVGAELVRMLSALFAPCVRPVGQDVPSSRTAAQRFSRSTASMLRSASALIVSDGFARPVLPGTSAPSTTYSPE